MTDDAAACLADAQQRSDRRPVLADHRDARYREVQDTTFFFGAVFEDQCGRLVVGGGALMAAVLGQIENVPIGEPGQLGGELVALALRGNDRHREAGWQDARDHAFDASDMIDIGNHALAETPALRRDHGHAARRHVDHLAGKFPAILKHVAGEQVDLDALVPAMLAARRGGGRIGIQKGHDARAPSA